MHSNWLHVFVCKEENCSNYAENVLDATEKKYSHLGLRSPDVVQVGVSHEENGEEPGETLWM